MAARSICKGRTPHTSQKQPTVAHPAPCAPGGTGTTEVTTDGAAGTTAVAASTVTDTTRGVKCAMGPMARVRACARRQRDGEHCASATRVLPCTVASNNAHPGDDARSGAAIDTHWVAKPPRKCDRHAGNQPPSSDRHAPGVSSSAVAHVCAAFQSRAKRRVLRGNVGLRFALALPLGVCCRLCGRPQAAASTPWAVRRQIVRVHRPRGPPRSLLTRRLNAREHATGPTDGRTVLPRTPRAAVPVLAPGGHPRGADGVASRSRRHRALVTGAGCVQ